MLDSNIVKYIDLKKNRFPDISPAKRDLLGIYRKLQLGVCSHGEPHVSSCMEGRGALLKRGKEGGVHWETGIETYTLIYI